VASQPYSAAGLAWGTAAGAVGAVGLVAYYQALATGQAAILAPLAASGAVLPLVFDLARGGSPGLVAMTGLVAAVLFGLFFIAVDLGGEAAEGSVLWVALGVQLGALPTSLAGAVRSRGRLGIDDPALLAPVALLTVLNLSADAFRPTR
jgi:hypothetical protein